MANPTPRLADDGTGLQRWRVDFRGKDFGSLGQHWLRSPPGDQIGAVHEAWALWLRLRAAAELESKQARLDFNGGPTFGAAADELADLRVKNERPHKENERYIRAQFRWIKAELGRHYFAAFIPPVGDELLIEYRNSLAERGLAPPTRSNRLSAVGQVLEYGWKKGWLPKMPHMPPPTVGGEILKRVSTHVLLEADFRVLYDRLWDDWTDRRHGLRKEFGHDAAKLEDVIARRRLYITVGFYTGMHTVDLNTLDDRSLNPFRGRFLRKNTKSAHCIAEVQKRMPEQLWLDVQREVRRLGRHWHEGEAVAGGCWPQVTKRLNKEGARLGLPLPITPTVFRHSVAYHLCLLGWSPIETAEYLGHVDDRMVRTVYNTVPPEDRSPEKLDWTNANMAKVTGGLAARAVVFDFDRAPALRAPEPHRGGPRLHALPAGDPEQPSPSGTRAAK